MYLQRMCDNASVPSWALLPAELLEKIFESIPRLLLENIGKVCRHWQDVLHHLAVKHLTSCIQNQLIEEKQLEKWGWCSATAWDHNILVCSCIHLAFNFFTGKEKQFLARRLSAVSMEYGQRIPVGIMSDKLFFATANEEKMVSIKVINRLEPESQPRVLKTLAVQQNDENDELNVHMVCCENLLVVLVFGTGPVSLWNGKNETWLADLDISSGLPDDHFRTYEVTVSKDLLAVYVGVGIRWCRVLFFRLNTDQPAASLPQLIGMVDMVDIDNLDDISVHMNEKWVGLWRVKGVELVVIKKTELFSEDQSEVVEMAAVADPQQAGNLWRKVGDARLATYLNLQPGSSDHLAVEHDHSSSFMILNLDTGEILCQISKTVDLQPTSWCGGAFLFLRKLKECEKFDVDKVQVVTYDFSQKIGVCTAEELEKEATCLLAGPVFEFSWAPSCDFSRYATRKLHVDYSGVVVWADLFSKLYFAAMD